MSYQILPNIIFIFAVLGILLIILRRLPEVSSESHAETGEPQIHEKLADKGLPTQAISKIRVGLTLTTKKIWNFMLEAKDLKPHSATGYKIKKIFGGGFSGLKKIPVQGGMPESVRDEQYYLDLIKAEPKNLSHYDALGKFYSEGENFNDAKDIYLYLVNHQPANPDFHARLAYSLYKTQNFDRAAEHYRKSLALDSTQPNRYYNLGLSLEAAGKLEEAGKALAYALELEPNNSKYQQALEKLKIKD